MTYSIEKFTRIRNNYKENGEAEEFYLIIQEIKSNPMCLFDTDFTDAHAALSILICTLSHSQTLLDQSDFLSLKSHIIELLICFVDHPEIAWFLNKNFEIISILIDEQRKHAGDAINTLILNCLDKYMKFVRNETLIFGVCDERCCNQDGKNELSERRVLMACSNIVSAFLRDANENASECAERSLMVLNDFYRYHNVQLSPESCGDVRQYTAFRHFLLSVCESGNYSVGCALSVLCCMLHCRDQGAATKSFNETNAECALALICNALLGKDLTSLELAVSLLTDMLTMVPGLPALITRLWTLEHLRTLCKLLFATVDTSPASTEAILHLLTVVVDTVPEWSRYLSKNLHPGSKLFKGLLAITGHQSERCAVLAWRLLTRSLQTSEVPEASMCEYVSSLAMSIRASLSACTSSDRRSVLGERSHLRALHRAQASVDLLLLLLDSDQLCDHLVDACVDTHLIDTAVSTTTHLLGQSHISTMVPYTVETLSPLLCQSHSAATSVARLSVSAVFACLSMSQNYPNKVAQSPIEPLLASAGLARMAAFCLSGVRDQRLLESTLALLAFCARMPQYDLAQVSELMLVNSACLSSSDCRAVGSSGTDLCTLLSTHAHIDNPSEPQSPSLGNTIGTLQAHIRVLEAHENALYQQIDSKDSHLRQCEDALVEQRNRTRASAVTIDRLMSAASRSHASLDASKAEIERLRVRNEESEVRLGVETRALAVATREMGLMQERVAALEASLAGARTDLEGAEALNNELRALLTKTEGEGRAKDAEIKRLTDLTQTIESLFRR